MRTYRWLSLLAAAVLTTACTPVGAAQDSDTGPFTGAGIPTMHGQLATCGGSHDKSFSLDVREVRVELGMGMRFDAWTYNGQLPAPVLEACEGDTVTITVAPTAE